MIDVLRAQKFWVDQIAGDFDMTSLMLKTLHELPTDGSMTMKDLAAQLWCDASNVTGIIDRLELRGLVERRPSATDRRVKCIILTPAGKRMRRKIDDRFNESPPAIAALSEADQQALKEILERALQNAAKGRTEHAE
jgi:DNA-binding MarR family transcriptional regulator